MRQILQYATNRTPQVRYHFADLPAFLPWLVRYFLASSPERALHSAMAELPLIQRSLIEHEALIAEADVPELLRRTGWIKLYRSDATLAKAVRELERAKQYGVAGDVLDAAAIAAREPQSDRRFRRRGAFSRARLCPRSRRPGQGLCGAVRPQGRPVSGRRCANARTIRRTVARRDPRKASITAREVVVAMGPWSDQIFAPLGYSIPLNVKRGYHICIWRRAATPCSIIPCWMPIRAFCWRR